MAQLNMSRNRNLPKKNQIRLKKTVSYVSGNPAGRLVLKNNSNETYKPSME